MLTIKKFQLPTCVECKMLDKVLDKISEKYPDINIEKIEATSEDAAKYGISTVPTMVFIKDGDAVKTVAHMQTIGKMEQLIAELGA